MNVQKKNRNKGAALLFIIFGLLFFILLVRFMTIQYTGEVKGTALAKQAQKMYMRSDLLHAKRGTIYDVKGEVIAEDTASYTLVAILDESATADSNRPNHVVDPEGTAKALSKHIDLEEQEIYELLTKKGRFQIEFGQAGRDLSHQAKQAIERLKLPGITFVKDTKRFYPNGVFASHLIGYAQREQYKDEHSKLIGKSGLEKSFNQLLEGEDGYIKYSGDIWNYILPNSKKQVKEPKDGQDIYLTIDKKVQTFLEDALNKVDKQFSPERMLAIVVDAKTGAIVAMGQRPTYHPVTREGIEKNWNNEIVESTFEPGSTMKIFSLAAAMEEKKFNPNERFKSGQYIVNKRSRPINDHNRGRGWGEITFLEGVQRSSNVAFARLLEKMGTDTWREYMDAFKFGKKTDIGLPNEASGHILYNQPIEKVTSVFGQGTTVTALQMVQAMTAVTNDGKMMKPYVIDKIVNESEGTVKKIEPKVVGKPISSETAKEVRKVLKTVVSAPKGTGHLYNIDGYEVAGKTGTSQLPSPTGGYLTGRNNYLFSFLGLAPIDDPQLIIYVAVEKPQLSDTDVGGVPVSMIFNPVMKNSLQYLNIEPKKNEAAKITQLPDLTKMKLKEATTFLKEHNLKPIIIGKGKEIVDQTPKEEMPLIQGEKVMIKTDGDLTIPDMTGWSKRDVLKVAALSDLKINFVGDGFVISQNLKPNSPVKAGDLLVVNFASPEQKKQNEEANEEEGNDAPLN